MMADNTIEQNLAAWDRDHQWSKDGDEWDGQAIACGRPYAEWKRSLIEHLILPFITPASTVIEIGPGHGRWSEAMLECKRLVLVDLSRSCIEHCRKRFAARANVSYHVCDGRSLPAHYAGEVDFVFSFDSFVHIGAAEMQAYLRHVYRVLKPGGRAVIHHANRRHRALWLSFLRSMGAYGDRLYRRLSIGASYGRDGWRSNVSAQLFKRAAEDAGLRVDRQMAFWADGIGVPRFNDRVTVMSKCSL